MDIDTFTTTPAGSLANITDSERMKYITELHQLPPSIQKVSYSPHTGAYIRGIAKTHNLNPSLAPLIAFSVLLIMLGKRSLASLPAILSSNLKIPNDKAQKIAQEIEKDIFSPIGKEFTTYLRQLKAREAEKKTSAGSPNKQAVQNVVNLKDKHHEPPPPKPRPNKPDEPIF